ncbi:hypothetical protein [Psychrobacter sp. HII-4]|uniref:hypothetical protein n=1 Tax=Psychrobacter sp. HII-4 TaxID=1569264 RepID=UPI0019182338|nr:hypothetical protein [Psychrobacter sp. HII-4]
MYKAKKSLNIANAFSFNKYQSQILSLIGFMILSLISTSSFALLANPGANCNGVADAAQGTLTNGDYNNLVTGFGTYVNVAGNDGGKIPLQIRMSTEESSTSTVKSNFGVITSDNKNAINIRRTFPTPSDYTDIKLEFLNSITEQPIYLTNVAISAFDIDYAFSWRGSNFNDYVQITGVTEADNTIEANLQPITGSNIDYSQGLYTTRTSVNCRAKNLGTACQGSVQFSQPVASINIRYTNRGRFFRNPTNQEIDFRVDNYCYVPQYIFSGIVFNDNGGITNMQADADNADITSNSSPYANNPSYFNGLFDTPLESGISGSTVRLTNCANGTTYPTQSVIKPGAPTGAYQISIPKTTLGSNTNLCLVESRTGNSYPIRTTTDNINTGFTTTTYHYPNRNFGRVITENAALVLRKAQYVNNCPSTIPYTDPALNRVGETDLRKGFSESANNGNALTPGQCIAYRITATNRANLPITNFVMQDKLQSKSDGAAVTSTLANPVASTTDYASNSVAIGNNGTVITNPFTLNARSNRNFYFNTKYGTTANTQ